MNVKHLILGILILGLVDSLGFANGDSNPIYGGGGGPMPSLLFLDLTDLNTATAATGYPALKEVLFLMGGGGYGGEVSGLRMGGYGVSGMTESLRGERTVEFEINYGGLMIEKAVDTQANLTLVLGTLVGGGTADLRLVSYLPDTFEDAVASPYVSTMSKDFFAVQPYVAFESQPLPWMWSRLQVGLLWTLTDHWTFEDAQFPGPPKALGGIIAQVMLRFGGQGVDTEDASELPTDTAESATADE